MTVQCPNCDTKYRLDETQVGQDGARVRCSRCSHVFTVSLPKADDGIEAVQDSDYDWLKDMDPAKDEPDGDRPDQEDVFSEPMYEKKNGAISLEIQPTKQPRSKSTTWILLGIALFSLFLGALVYFPNLKDAILSRFVSDEPETIEKTAEVLTGEQVNLISLHNVRQYFVANDKIGQLFVIEGKARNDFPTHMEMIRIEASLFDGAGRVVERQVFLAGNTVSLFQLQILSEEELMDALQAKVGILSNNTNLRPGADVPFMVAFPNPPDEVQEYGLKVIEAQHPPQ